MTWPRNCYVTTWVHVTATRPSPPQPGREDMALHDSFKQKTLARVVSVEGVGLHGGAPVQVVLRPDRSGRGLVFRRLDLERQAAWSGGRRMRVEIPAAASCVTHSDHATTLTARTPAGDASVQTVEHLLAALHVMEVDACIVEIDGPEVPILDGSAAPWVALVRSAGLRTADRPRRVRRIVEPFSVTSGDSSISAYPASGLRVTCSIAFSHPAIGTEERSWLVTPETFARELAPARTFGFLRDVEQLRAAGLVKGGSLENAVVLDDTKVINGPLRFEDEFVRHKAMDLLGDLALMGAPLVGHVVARRAGHRLHAEFARQLLASPAHWRLEPAGRASEELSTVVAGSAEMALPASHE